jgi:hypothetical protein
VYVMLIILNCLLYIVAEALTSVLNVILKESKPFFVMDVTVV